MSIILKILFAKTAFHVLNYVVPHEFPQELKRLVASDFGSKIVVPLQKPVEIINSL